MGVVRMGDWVKVEIAPFVVDRQTAAMMLNGESNLDRVVKSRWLEPIAGKERGMDFAVKDIETCANRLRLEGWPEEKDPDKREKAKKVKRDPSISGDN